MILQVCDGVSKVFYVLIEYCFLEHCLFLPQRDIMEEDTLFFKISKKKYVEAFGNVQRGFVEHKTGASTVENSPFVGNILCNSLQVLGLFLHFITSCKVLFVRFNCNREVLKCSASLLHTDYYSGCNSARNCGENILLIVLTFQCNNTVINLQRKISFVPIYIRCYVNSVFGNLVFILTLRAGKKRGMRERCF